MLDKIRKLAEEKGMTIAELERQANITPKAICKWNVVMPAADKLARVARALDVTVEDLLDNGQTEPGQEKEAI